jgi:hypothetical protein
MLQNLKATYGIKRFFVDGAQLTQWLLDHVQAGVTRLSCGTGIEFGAYNLVTVSTCDFPEFSGAAPDFKDRPAPPQFERSDTIFPFIFLIVPGNKLRLSIEPL